MKLFITGMWHKFDTVVNVTMASNHMCGRILCITLYCYIPFNNLQQFISYKIKVRYMYLKDACKTAGTY